MERPGEEAQFDDPALALVQFRQAVERIVQAEQIDIGADVWGTAMASSSASLTAPEPRFSACCERA